MLNLKIVKVSLGLFTMNVLGIIGTQITLADPPPPGYPINEVVLSTTDADNKRIVMRRGYWDHKVPNGGFGYDKIYHKHNLKKINAVKFILKNPNGGEQEGSTSTYRYHAWANHLNCGILTCKVDKTVKVRAVVNFRYDYDAKGQKGVITAYCISPEKANRCEDWVDQSLNVQKKNNNYIATRTKEADKGNEPYTVMSYEPYNNGELLYKSELEAQTTEEPSLLIEPGTSEDTSPLIEPGTSDDTSPLIEPETTEDTLQNAL